MTAADHLGALGLHATCERYRVCLVVISRDIAPAQRASGGHA